MAQGNPYPIPIEKYTDLATGRRNVTQSEGASETSISSRVKTNLSTMDFYADLCFPRPGEIGFRIKICLRKKGNILRIILTEK